MPAASDIDLLLGLLSHFRDLGMVGNRAKEAVDVDLAPALGEFDVLFGSEFLIAVCVSKSFEVGIRQLRDVEVRELRV
jgi:hypothetical protein